jgi:gas vesicle protein
MKKGTKRLLGGVAVAGGAIGAIGALILRNNSARRKRQLENAWARPGMPVVFRAELMPGRERSERTFHVLELLPSGRVLLQNFAGEHAEKEFERVR